MEKGRRRRALLGANVGHTLRVSAQVSSLIMMRRFVENTTGALQASLAAIADLVQAVDESVTNIIFHGYQGRPGDIEVEMRKEQDALVICLRDQAPLFDPTLVPPPDLTLPQEQRCLGGLGIFLTRRFTDAMGHRVTPEGGNELTLRKNHN
ncbi:MAG: ATP-binding protein [candidate division NC10 bacterium]